MLRVALVAACLVATVPPARAGTCHSRSHVVGWNRCHHFGDEWSSPIAATEALGETRLWFTSTVLHSGSMAFDSTLFRFEAQAWWSFYLAGEVIGSSMASHTTSF